MKYRPSKKTLILIVFIALALGILALASYFLVFKASAATDPNFIKTVDKVTASQGDELIYTITYTNTTGQTIENFVLKDAIPANTIFIPGTYFGNPTLIDNVLTWPSRSVANNVTLTTSFKVLVDITAPVTPTPTVTISPSPTPSDDVVAKIISADKVNVGYKASFDATQSTGWNRVGENDYNGLENYTWDFGDGSPVESGPYNSAISHVFANTGNYTVKLTVTDFRGGINTATKFVQVANLPKVTVNGFNDNDVLNAITSLNGQPGIVYMPAGTYTFDHQIVPGNGQVIEGAGKDQTIVNITGSQAFTISSNNIAVSGITFQPPVDPRTAAADAYWPNFMVISVDSNRDGRKNIYVHDCEMVHVNYGTGLPMHRTWIEYDSSGNQLPYVLPYRSGASGLFENNEFHMTAKYGSGYGIQADRGSYYVIKNNEFYSNRHSVAGGGQSGQSKDPDFNYWSYKSSYDIVGNTFHGPNAEAIACTLPSGSACFYTDVAIDMHVGGRGRFRISENTFKDIKAAIGLHDGWGEIKNNKFINAGSNGRMIVFDEGKHNNIYHCPDTVDAFDKATGASYVKSGSEICIGAHDFNISGNTFETMPRPVYFVFDYLAPPKNMYIDGCKVISATFSGKGLPGEPGMDPACN